MKYLKSCTTRLLEPIGIALVLSVNSVINASIGALVPAYFYPTEGDQWDRLIAAADRIPVVAIVNPQSGPGPVKDPEFEQAIFRLRDAGGRALGFVLTEFGQRDLVVVKADIDRYFEFYSVDGIYFAHTGLIDVADNLLYYEELYAYVKEKNADALVVSDESSMALYLSHPVADNVALFGNEPGFREFFTSTWILDYAAQSFTFLASGIESVETMAALVEEVANEHIGYIYMTSENHENPWDTLPVYWEEMVALIEARNQTATSLVLSIGFNEDSEVEVSISGAPGSYVIEASDNLQQWDAISTVNTETGTATVTDSASRSLDRRFYRSRSESIP